MLSITCENFAPLNKMTNRNTMESSPPVHQPRDGAIKKRRTIMREQKKSLQNPNQRVEVPTLSFSLSTSERWGILFRCFQKLALPTLQIPMALHLRIADRLRLSSPHPTLHAHTTKFRPFVSGAMSSMTLPSTAFKMTRLLQALWKPKGATFVSPFNLSHALLMYSHAVSDPHMPGAK